jgi:biopolymer transport protein ExbB
MRTCLPPLVILLLLATALARAGQPAAAPTPTTATRPTTHTPAEPTTAAQPATSAPAAAQAPEPPDEPSSTILRRNLWETLRGGGALMYPILLCSLIGLAFTIERFVALRQRAVAPKALADQVLEGVQQGKPEAALRLCEKRPSSLARVLAAGLALADRPREEVVGAMEEAGERELWNLDRFAKPLSIIAGVAPLLGLLGTVWGMIIAFDVVAQKGALGDPRALASGIATALLTTLAGLTVAIPSYVLYHYFRSRSDRLIIQIEETASHIATALHGGHSHANPSPKGRERGAPADAAD